MRARKKFKALTARIKMKVRKKIRHVRHVTKGRPVRQVKKEKHVRGKGAKTRRHVRQVST